MGLFDIFKNKKKQEETTKTVPVIEETSSTASTAIEGQQSGLSVLLEQLPTTYELDENKLVEITDSSILDRISTLVTSVGSVKVSISNVINNLNTQQGETLYKVILQNGGKLVDSKNTPGAKRAFTMVGNRINENAELIAVDRVVDKGALAANAGAAVMGVASMVVGQYYMQQVDTQLGLISDSISKVVDFMEIQYKSQVASLMESVHNISKFQMSSIENEELRGRELDNILLLRGKCQELLYQAETTLEKLTNENCPSFDEYENKIKEIGKWSQYQTILVKILYQIDILDFALHLGVKSKEQCFGSFSLHTGKIEAIHDRLVEWHSSQCEALKIDLDENRRKHTGILALLEKPISWINDDWNYHIMEGQIVSMIKDQTAELPAMSYSDENLFNEDVQIIARDGKYYYLPVDNNT